MAIVPQCFIARHLHSYIIWERETRGVSQNTDTIDKKLGVMNSAANTKSNAWTHFGEVN